VETHILKRDCEVRDVLLDYAKDGIFLEGSLLKLVRSEPEDEEFHQYLITAKQRDIDVRRKRLKITKQIQTQNDELAKASRVRDKLTDELEEALKISQENENKALSSYKKAEEVKENALKDLEVLQKKTRFKLMSLIVRVALTIIIGVGITTTLLYAYIIASGADTTIIETTWSNLFGILITNSFSIIGTIMGVRYANDKLKDIEL